jgi:hypothetical protein
VPWSCGARPHKSTRPRFCSFGAAQHILFKSDDARGQKAEGGTPCWGCGVRPTKTFECMHSDTPCSSHSLVCTCVATLALLLACHAQPACQLASACGQPRLTAWPLVLYRSEPSEKARCGVNGCECSASSAHYALSLTCDAFVRSEIPDVAMRTRALSHFRQLPLPAGSASLACFSRRRSGSNPSWALRLHLCGTEVLTRFLKSECIHAHRPLTCCAVRRELARDRAESNWCLHRDFSLHCCHCH